LPNDAMPNSKMMADTTQATMSEMVYGATLDMA
jgi:hypothetical protein